MPKQAEIIDGKKIAAQLNEETRRAVADAAALAGAAPRLAVVLVGDNPASKVYVSMKQKKCAELGISSSLVTLAADATTKEVVAAVERLNADPGVNGILVQSPPPRQVDERAVIDAILPSKDVDCFTPHNVGRLAIGDRDGFIPCTPGGVLELLRRSGVRTAGAEVVVVGRSNIVGKPLALLLSAKGADGDATVTLCHSRTRDIKSHTLRADILVAAIGVPEFIRGDMVREGAVVVDVGINRVADASAKDGYRLVGDVCFAEAELRAALITPVPGGVGPMTIAMLMRNTLKAFLRQNRLPVANPAATTLDPPCPSLPCPSLG